MSLANQEINLHVQLAIAHQQLAQAKTEILRLLEKSKEDLINYSQSIENTQQAVLLLKESLIKTSLPFNMPHIKTLRDEGFDFIESLPENLTSIRGIGPDKAGKILMFLERNGHGE